MKSDEPSGKRTCFADTIAPRLGQTDTVTWQSGLIPQITQNLTLSDDLWSPPPPKGEEIVSTMKRRRGNTVGRVRLHFHCVFLALQLPTGFFESPFCPAPQDIC